jgi:hypothetical protein
MSHLPCVWPYGTDEFDWRGLGKLLRHLLAAAFFHRRVNFR